MNFQYFGIDTIPDLTLSKYSFFDEGGVDGVLKKTNAFLRQIHRKGLLSRVFWHLLYVYDPKAPAGHRMKNFFIASGQNPNSLLYTRELVQKSALSAFYNFQNVAYEPMVGPVSAFYNFQNVGYKPMVGPVRSTFLPLKRQDYQCAAVLLKRVFSVEPSVIRPDDQDVKFHRVTEWKMNENARLYNLFQLMHGLDKPAAFRIDLFPVDYAAGLRDVLPIQELRSRTSMRSGMGGSGISFQRDENAEETLRQYESIIKNYESSPHFRANILTFASKEEIAAKLLIDAAGAEALASGNYQIETITPPTTCETHHIFDYMDTPVKGAWLDNLGKLAFLPSLFLLEEIRPFFSFPALYDGEVIEIPKETAPKLDETGFDLGEDENEHQISIETRLFKKHAFIAGVPGSGKTNTMLHLATTFWKTYRVPFLILEPAKKEYRALTKIEGMKKLMIFSPSSGTMFPLHINPFEFPVGMPLAEHIQNLMAVFEGAFQLAGPAPFLIDRAMEAVYRKKGWRPNTKNSNKLKLHYPTLSEFHQQISAEVDAAGYEGELKSNLKSFVQVRLGSLLSREMGDLFDVSSSTLKPEEWLTRPALIELEAMGSGPANFLTLLLCTLIRETLKVAPRDDRKYEKKPRHVIFLEEAHNLIGPEANEVTGENASPKLAATAYIVKMLAEVRALHESIIIADQLPSKMAPEVIKNTGLKIAHRLTAEDDRNLLGGTMSANATQLEQMATYEVGDALVATEKLLRPYKARIHKWQENNAQYEPPTDEELSKRFVESKNPAYNHQLKRNMQISYDKCKLKHRKLSSVVKRLRKYSQSLKDIMPNLIANESAYEQLARQLEKSKEKLGKRAASLLVLVVNLYYLEKRYVEQNPVYKKKFFRLLQGLYNAWVDIYVIAKTLCPESAERYKADNEEVEKFYEVVMK